MDSISLHSSLHKKLVYYWHESGCFRKRETAKRQKNEKKESGMARKRERRKTIKECLRKMWDPKMLILSKYCDKECFSHSGSGKNAIQFLFSWDYFPTTFK